MNIEIPFRKYGPFWGKYRPAILKMMQSPLNEWQQYQFMKHELTAIDKKPKGGYDFHVVLSGTSNSSQVRNSEIAKDFLNMLQGSKTGSALLATNKYEIILDKQLALHISRQSLSAPVPAETE